MSVPGAGEASVEVETWVPFRQLEEPVLRVQTKTPPFFEKLVQLTKVSPWPSDTAANPPPENLSCWANWTRTIPGPCGPGTGLATVVPRGAVVVVVVGALLGAGREPLLSGRPLALGPPIVAWTWASAAAKQTPRPLVRPTS
jgi:hypothetical protein